MGNKGTEPSIASVKGFVFCEIAKLNFAGVQVKLNCKKLNF